MVTGAHEEKLVSGLVGSRIEFEQDHARWALCRCEEGVWVVGLLGKIGHWADCAYHWALPVCFNLGHICGL